MSAKKLVIELNRVGAIKFGNFTLKSGKKSPYYIDLRLLSSHPKVLKLAGKALGEIIIDELNKPTVLCGIPSAGLAIANAVSIVYDIPSIYLRKEPAIYKEITENLRKKLEDDKQLLDSDRCGVERALQIIESLSGLKAHGIPRLLDGTYTNGDRIGIVDDLITTAESKIEAVDQLLKDARSKSLNVTIAGVYVLLDREQGGKEALQREGLKLHSVITMREAAKYLLKSGALSNEMFEMINNYIISERKEMQLE